MRVTGADLLTLHSVAELARILDLRQATMTSSLMHAWLYENSYKRNGDPLTPHALLTMIVRAESGRINENATLSLHSFFDIVVVNSIFHELMKK